MGESRTCSSGGVSGLRLLCEPASRDGNWEREREKPCFDGLFAVGIVYVVLERN